MNDSLAGHVSTETLLSYLDATLTEPEASGVRKHLSNCARCSRALDSLRQFDALARSTPRETAGAELVRAVMLRVGIVPRQSLFVRAVEVVPYVVALLVVSGMLLAVFVWTGAITPSPWSGMPASASEAYATAESAIDGITGAVGGFLSRMVPAVSASGLRLWIGLGLILTAIAVLDRIFSWRIVHRPR